MKEYIGVRYEWLEEFITVRIIANNQMEASHKFINYLKEQGFSVKFGDDNIRVRPIDILDTII